MLTNNGINSPSPTEVEHGGTGVDEATPYAVILGGTTSTAPLQFIASVGTAGQVLTSNGVGAKPTFQAPAAAPDLSGYALKSTTFTINGTSNQIGSSAGAQDLSTNRTWTISLADNPIIPGTAKVTIPVGSTAQRPGTPANGDLRINTTLGTTEVYRGGDWRNLEQTATPGDFVVLQTEVDFGSGNETEKSFTITDPDVATDSQILLTMAGDAPTDKDQDELEMDAFYMWALPGAGEFTLFMRALDGPVHGKFKINYVKG